MPPSMKHIIMDRALLMTSLLLAGCVSTMLLPGLRLAYAQSTASNSSISNTGTAAEPGTGSANAATDGITTAVNPSTLPNGTASSRTNGSTAPSTNVSGGLLIPLSAVPPATAAVAAPLPPVEPGWRLGRTTYYGAPQSFAGAFDAVR